MIGIIKGDVRYTYLSQMLDNSIISDSLKDFIGIDVLILPLSGINNNYIIKQTTINIMDILNNNRIKLIITGNANNELIDLCNKYEIKLYELLKDYEFVIENAYLTAKGALYLIHNGICDIKDKTILLTGYGNIGFHLAKILNSQDINVNIYTENIIEKKYAMLEGYKIIDNINDSYDIIINTIPNNIELDYSKLKNSIIYDLASLPYGFDINKINLNSLDYRILSNIPSKYAPKSAAIILKKIIENKIFSCMWQKNII